MAAQTTAALEKEAADLEKAAVAARKKVEEAKAQEAAYFNATAKASGVAAAKQPQGKKAAPKAKAQAPAKAPGKASAAVAAN